MNTSQKTSDHKTKPIIKLYGAERCHKTRFYKDLLSQLDKEFEFMDVEQDLEKAEELRDLYESRRLNFPTLTIGKKRLRNPNREELIKWLNKLA